MRARQRKERRQRGGAAVEMALLLLPFLLFVFGIMDFGMYFWARHVVTEAACEGGRLALLNDPTNAEITDAVTAMVADGGVQGTPSVSIGARAPLTPVSVSVSVPYSFVILPSLVPGFTGTTTISATATTVHERG